MVAVRVTCEVSRWYTMQPPNPRGRALNECLITTRVVAGHAGGAPRWELGTLYNKLAGSCHRPFRPLLVPGAWFCLMFQWWRAQARPSRGWGQAHMPVCHDGHLAGVAPGHSYPLLHPRAG